tara:strand:- start:306 stop:737 length:432 start_codon:yes stop_codon:yes gene_type:complete
MVIEGVSQWASILTPNTTYEPKYCIDLILAEQIAEDLKAQGYNIKDKEGGPTITISRKVSGPNGMTRKAPTLMDAQKAPLDCLVGNGSKVRVQARPWEMNRNGQDFKGLELQAVQVIDLIEYRGADGDELDAIDSDEKEVDEL